MMNDAIGGLSLVKFDISGYSLMNSVRFFSTAKCLQFKSAYKKIFSQEAFKTVNSKLAIAKQTKIKKRKEKGLILLHTLFVTRENSTKVTKEL